MAAPSRPSVPFSNGSGSLDDLYVVFSAPDGYTIGDYEDDIDAGGSTTLAAAPEIARVDPGRIDDSRDWGWLADHELLLLDDANLHEALRASDARWHAHGARGLARVARGPVFAR